MAHDEAQPDTSKDQAGSPSTATGEGHEHGRSDERSEHELPDASKEERNPEATEQSQAERPTDSDESNTRAESSSETKTYNWCKCYCSPDEHGGKDHYYLHFVTQESRWDEPDEPYWIWDANTQAVDSSGLQNPSIHKAQSAPGTTSGKVESETDSEYHGYNPKIHGHYDPNAPYAQYHNKKREVEATPSDDFLSQGQVGTYETSATFNRVTGAYQSADQNADRHNDANKSSRQLNAFFDVDAAANAHEGRSLKAERQQQKFSKKEIKEMAAKRREKKEKKRMDFYRS